MERDIILNGIHIGEHAFCPESVIEEIKERCIDCGFNYVSIRPRGAEFEQKFFLECARYLAEHKIYFSFNYLTQYPPEGRESRIEGETVRQMVELAGEYFLGELLGEPGSSYACKLPGYYMAAAKDAHQTGKKEMEVDPTKYRDIYRNYRLEKYQNMEAGVTVPVLEILPGNPDILAAVTRGAAWAYSAEMWGTFFAHEWYGGMRHDDTLKKKRLELAYKYAYLAGSRMFLLESGDTGVSSYGMKYAADSDVCRNYQRVLRMMQEYMKEDIRPAGEPRVTVAFVSGLHDGWSGRWGRSCLWNQFYREEWGYDAAEHSWMLLDEIYTKRNWGDSANFGDYDTSAGPAYGLYDIVPIEADIDKLCRYDYLIFLGWNTMTEAVMDKLTEYVRQGGHLVMSAAHLNTRTERVGEYLPVLDEKIEELFGCRFMGEIRRTVQGVVFKYDSLDPEVMYPVYHTGGCDPMYAAGYADYARFAVCDGQTIAYASDSFAERLSDLPMVIENRLGDGVATLVTHVDYPGDRAVSLLYRTVVREIIAASARNCDVKVIGSDRIRYSVYENGKMYLLNTDYDLPANVKILWGSKEQMVTLEALELKSLQL